MRNKVLSPRRIDYQNSPEDRRILSMYLQAAEMRKKRLVIRDPAIARARFFFYFLAGSFLLTGLFFVFF